MEKMLRSMQNRDVVLKLYSKFKYKAKFSSYVLVNNVRGYLILIA